MLVPVSAKMNVETGAMTYVYKECDEKVFAEYIRKVVELVAENKNDILTCAKKSDQSKHSIIEVQ